MSFLAASEDTMAFELWPKAMKNEVRRLQGDEGYVAWQLFPCSLQAMAKWADVYQDPKQKDKSRDHILIYKDVEDAQPGTIYPVAICLQGMLGRFCIERFGYWSGSGIAGMNQKLHALSNTCIFHVEDTNKLGKLPSIPLILPVNMNREQERIVLAKEPALMAAQDPGGKYICVQELWNVVHPLTVADLTGKGKVLPMDAIHLTEGDFVDVGAELDFVMSRD
ncbi:hypothetical protein DFJ58DRAFT_842249 [Suillus subalutaceus]|uniref:uncharacterized protein n=1 Tax=Suillus subalutaceus TaxID=48586 RepID=UPI001B86AA70|nr:uncharacterized protein DFJ58DRAFT_842249 [Suillus subalutaceus]KAG1851053.1 hypothetical protein DFJ58DRAFT_842249 [Suillus subalutaceus]